MRETQRRVIPPRFAHRALRGTSHLRCRFHLRRRPRYPSPMPRPLIGITLDYGEKPNRYMLPCDYATSIERAGGIPLAIPYRTDLSLIPEILDRLDGVLFSGGDDLDPMLYGEQRHPRAEPIDPDRQQFE